MLIWVFVTILFHLTGSAAISCYGDSGKAVDWFIVYKLPKLTHDPDAGMTYMYQDGDSGGWVPGKSLMNNTDSAVGQTLSQIYGVTKTKDVAFILYNDQPPSTVATNQIRGHTKGVVLLDKSQGFWLVHSTPHFPPPADQKYDWPHNALHNGQSFLCVTYPYSHFNDIGTQLLYNTISPYSSLVPDNFAGDLPDLKAAAQMESVTKPPWSSLVTLTSVGGKTFTSFSKNGNFGDDLYSGWISRVLKSDLYVEFWLNSRRTLHSNCSQTYHIYNMKDIRFSQSIQYSSHIDHSKWCVSVHPNPGWACVGDMNRNIEEEQRGGGAVCVQDTNVWKSFSSLVSNFSKCD
ncbi:deoxyribonuclease-2-alpha [Pelodytes ibericus]